MRAWEYESDLPTVAAATSRRDPRLAPDPGLDPFVASLLGQDCPPGDLPLHPDNGLVTCSLAPAVTPVDDAYLSPACVMCVMIDAGFRVVPIGPLPPLPAEQDQGCALTARSRAHFQLCFGGHWVVTNTGYARHS